MKGFTHETLRPQCGISGSYVGCDVEDAVVKIIIRMKMEGKDGQMNTV
jgi:hypothetical protein